MNVDSLATIVNKLTGLGVRGYDSGLSSEFGLMPSYDRSYLNNIYRTSWAARKVVDYLPAMMARRWGAIQLAEGKQETIEEIGKKIAPLKRKYEVAQQTANKYGGAAILRIVEDGKDPIEPLSTDKAIEVEYSRILDRWEIYPTADALLKDWLDPEYYQISSHDLFLTVHKTRVIRFDGAFSGKEGRELGFGWDDSVLAAFFEPLRRHLSALGYVGEAIGSFEIFIHYIQGLFDRLDDDDKNGKEKMLERLKLNQQQRSVLRGTIADLDAEKFEYVSRRFSGVGDILDRLRDEMVAASGLTKPQFLQEHPSGLAATGESERKAEANEIEALQEKKWGEQIRFDCALWVGTEYGWEWHWHNLYQPTPSEESEIREKQSRSDRAYIEMGAVTAEEIRQSRFGGANYSIETTLIDRRERSNSDKKDPPRFGNRVRWNDRGTIKEGKILEVISRSIVAIDGEKNGTIENPVLLIDTGSERLMRLLSEIG